MFGEPPANSMTRTRILVRIRDLLAYVTAGITLVAAAILYAVHQARTGGSPALPLKWLGFGGMTAITFGYCIRWHSPSVRNWKLWILWLALLAFHLAAGFFLLSRVSTIPLIYFVGAVIIETPILHKILYRYIRAGG